MIVAIESASTDLSIALAEATGALLADEGWSAGHRHGSELLPRLLKLAAGIGRPLRSASTVVVGIGPGSFTGLRVGMSVAKAIAYAAECPIIGVSSLSAWLRSEPDTVAAVGRAGAREFYVQAAADEEPMIVDIDAFPAELRGAALVAPADVAEQLSLRRARPPFRAAAGLVATAAARERAARASDDLETLEPRYLRAPRGVQPEASLGR